MLASQNTSVWRETAVVFISVIEINTVFFLFVCLLFSIYHVVVKNMEKHHDNTYYNDTSYHLSTRFKKSYWIERGNRFTKLTMESKSQIG